MARQREFYKGRRKKRNYAIIPAVILILVISVVIVLFYSMQKYAVISEDGIEIKLPILQEDSDGTVIDASGNEVRVYEDAYAELSFLPADYSSVEASAGKNATPVRAIFIPYEEVLDADKIDEYANRLSTGNALMFELKKEDGYLAWYSDSATAFSYGLNMASTDSKEFLTNQISQLKQEDIYLVAQISACIDGLFGSHCPSVTIKNQYGYDYGDAKGYYVDPYSPLVRNYIVELCSELYDMGFDEVVLSNVCCPIIDEDDDTELYFTGEMSTTPTKVGAVSGFVVNVSDALSERGTDKRLSAYVDTATARVRADSSNGQDGPLFMKVFDRVYLNTDRYAYQYNCQDFESSVTIGDIYDRLVPVVINYLPDTTSWILIDSEE